MVNQAISHLQSSFDAFQELHEWYLLHTQLEEGELEGDDYVRQVVKAFSTPKRKYVKYKKAAQTMEAEMKEAAEAAWIQEQNQAKLTTLHKNVQ